MWKHIISVVITRYILVHTSLFYIGLIDYVNQGIPKYATVVYYEPGSDFINQKRQFYWEISI